MALKLFSKRNFHFLRNGYGDETIEIFTDENGEKFYMDGDSVCPASELRESSETCIVSDVLVETEHNAGFVPRASDISYMDSEDDISFPDLPERQ